MALLSALTALLSLAVLIAALFNRLRPLDDGTPGTRTAEKAVEN